MGRPAGRAAAARRPRRFHRPNLHRPTNLIMTTTFRGCRTTGTSYPDDCGGAIYLFGIPVNLGFSGCMFEDCWAFSAGGAVCASPCRSFCMNETSGNNCSADFAHSFCLIYSYTSMNQFIEVRDAGAVSCRCSGEATFSCGCDSYSSGNATSVESVNSSANYAELGGSAFHFSRHFELSLHFCTFS
jgi:hypothetical protein